MYRIDIVRSSFRSITSVYTLLQALSRSGEERSSSEPQVIQRSNVSACANVVMTRWRAFRLSEPINEYRFLSLFFSRPPSINTHSLSCQSLAQTILRVTMHESTFGLRVHPARKTHFFISLIFFSLKEFRHQFLCGGQKEGSSFGRLRWLLWFVPFLKRN